MQNPRFLVQKPGFCTRFRTRKGPISSWRDSCFLTCRLTFLVYPAWTIWNDDGRIWNAVERSLKAAIARRSGLLECSVFSELTGIGTGAGTGTGTEGLLAPQTPSARSAGRHVACAPAALRLDLDALGLWFDCGSAVVGPHDGSGPGGLRGAWAAVSFTSDA